MSNDSNTFQSNPSNPGAFNPYAPTPTTNDAYVQAVPSDVEQFRKKYLTHEASVKSIGVLYLIGAFLLVPMGVFIIVGSLSGGNQANGAPLVIAAVGGFYIILGFFQGFVGAGLRKLRGWTRTAAIVLSAFGLLGFPVGTLISGYFLYLLASEKGRIVFSEQYKEAIAQTPHIKYKTSIVVWIFLGLLVALIAVGVLALLFSGGKR